MSAQIIRANGWAMVALAGAGAVLTILSMPPGLLEMLVASAGISELVPAAAPPLGLKARLLIALFAGLVAAGAVALVRRDRPEPSQHISKHGRENDARGADTMGFALSKLTAIARGQGRFPFRSGERLAAPSLRRADAHPDAPARAPIFASRDFGGLDIFARTEPGRREIVVEPEPEADPVVPATGLVMPSAPSALPDELLRVPGFARPTDVPAIDGHEVAAAPLRLAPLPDAAEPGPAFAPPAPIAELLPGLTQVAAAAVPTPDPAMTALSVRELAERLERGLSARAKIGSVAAPVPERIADMPVAAPAQVRPAVDADVDQALTHALGALRSMAGRAR